MLSSVASSNRVRSREQTIPAAENALSASTLEGGKQVVVNKLKKSTKKTVK